MELKPGFQQTEAGAIPDDWSAVTIQTLIDRSAVIGHIDGNHGELYPRSSEFKSAGVPYITANDLMGHRVSFAECKFLAHERAAMFRKGVARNGDVLFAHNATVGPTALLSSDCDYVILSTTVTYFRCSREKLSNSFFLYALQSPSFVGQYTSVMSQSTRNQVPISAQRKLWVTLPSSKAEQEAISGALSDADALIESLEQLVAKKRRIKQGAMQELLTGKRRLPGFSGEWEVRRLEAISGIRSGGTPSTLDAAAWDGDFPWCTPTDITALDGKKYLSTTARTITAHGLKQSSAEVIPPGSVVMTSRATIGECAINAIPVTTNQGFKNFVPVESVDGEFLYYLLCTQKSGFISLCGGSTFLEIGKAQLRGYEVRLPPAKAEQSAIAAVLSDMDTELAALEAKLTKARQIKQGMMQNLLTGRIRLI